MKVYITGEINYEKFGEFSQSLAHLEYAPESVRHPTIEVELSSAGGLADSALAYSSRIRDSKAEIHIHAYGAVESAAVLVLASGDRRTMDRHAHVMVHESSIENFSGNVSQLEKAALLSRKFETQWNELMAFYTKASVEKWAALHKEETILTPKECLELGLIDEII